MNKTAALVTVLIIFLLAIFLRFYNLGEQGFWVDELNHVFVAQSLQNDGTFNLPSGEPYSRAKLFAFATVISIKIFGVSEFSLRLPSALFGLLSLILVFYFVRRLFGFPVALVSLLLLTIIPFETGWARTSRFYTIFQFFTLCSWYFFYAGFENVFKTTIIKKQEFKTSVLSVIKSWNLNWKYLLLFIVFSLIAISIQIIGGLIFLALLAYFTLLTMYLLWTGGIKTAIFSKYFIFLALVFLIITISFLFVPKIKEFVVFSLSYLPAWAQNDVSQDRLLFVKFIMGKKLFPIGALFLIGLWQSVLRLNKRILYTALFFLVPVFMFTFVFSYRAYHYIYNIFPFFVIIAAYGIVNIVDSERNFLLSRVNIFNKLKISSKKLQSSLIFAMFFLFVSFSEFTKDGLAIPFGKGGDSNGAVTLLEWPAAFDFVKNQDDGQSIIIASVPLASCYYLGKIDFSMNFSGLDMSREQNLVDDGGKNFDFYSGTRFIEDVIALDSLVHSGKAGFIIVDSYRFFLDLIIPENIRAYILTNLTEEFVSPNNTVFVYSWRSNVKPEPTKKQ